MKQAGAWSHHQGSFFKEVLEKEFSKGGNQLRNAFIELAFESAGKKDVSEQFVNAEFLHKGAQPMELKGLKRFIFCWVHGMPGYDSSRYGPFRTKWRVRAGQKLRVYWLDKTHLARFFRYDFKTAKDTSGDDKVLHLLDSAASDIAFDALQFGSTEVCLFKPAFAKLEDVDLSPSERVDDNYCSPSPDSDD